jgi:hypothetical protein
MAVLFSWCDMPLHAVRLTTAIASTAAPAVRVMVCLFRIAELLV